MFDQSYYTQKNPPFPYSQYIGLKTPDIFIRSIVVSYETRQEDQA